MGAGCRYTLTEDRDELALWADVPDIDYDNIHPDEHGDAHDFYYRELKENLVASLMKMPLVAQYGHPEKYVGKGKYERDYNRLYYGENLYIVLEPTYDECGIIINLEYQSDDPSPLAVYNYARSYAKIVRHVNKSMELRIATSGYTSALYEVGELCRRNT